MIELAPQHKQGLVLASPVMNAAGTLGFAGEYRGLVDLDSLGAFVTNPLTLNPRTPAHPPNAVELPNGLLIHTGLPNPGVRRALKRHDADWRRLSVPVIVHLAATTAPEVGLALEYLERAQGVGGVELGLRDDVSPGEVGRLMRAALGALPVIVRLPLARAVALAPAAAQAGANALVVAAPPRVSVPHKEYMVTGRHYGPDTFAPALAALSAVVALDLGLPLIGAGGIYSVENARAMLEAGAVAVQIDAAIWKRPDVVKEMNVIGAG
jgi:dihydroorotate dehydrogenase (NAD+) catalytic subunit